MAQTVKDLKKHLSDLQLAASNSAPATPEELARKLHSLKGFAGMYALDQMHDAVDHMEMELRHFQTATLPTTIKAFASLEQSAGHVMDITESLDPSLKKRRLGIVIAPHEFDELLKCVQNQDYAQAERILSSSRSMEAGQLFSAWPVTAQRLSNQVEKDVQFILDGDDAFLPLGTFNELGRALPQLLRNAIDHGIELPGFREQIGKPRVGSIKAQLAKMEHRLKITISDDGAGIDFSKLAQSALARQVIQPELVEQYTQAGELWRIMFVPGFSTAQVDTEMKSLSGLGVGLDSLHHTIQNLGGSIAVSSELGQGTQVRIEIPLSAPIHSTINGA
jgi:two-component system chemotaxis sensor kinase CheA